MLGANGIVGAGMPIATGAALAAQLDGQGRVAMPSQLKEYAGIADEVIIAGANNYFEIWNKEQWEQEKAISQEQSWQIIESLERD